MTFFFFFWRGIFPCRDSFLFSVLDQADVCALSEERVCLDVEWAPQPAHYVSLVTPVSSEWNAWAC